MSYTPRTQTSNLWRGLVGWPLVATAVAGIVAYFGTMEWGDDLIAFAIMGTFIAVPVGLVGLAIASDSTGERIVSAILAAVVVLVDATVRMSEFDWIRTERYTRVDREALVHRVVDDHAPLRIGIGPHQPRVVPMGRRFFHISSTRECRSTGSTTTQRDDVTVSRSEPDCVEGAEVGTDVTPSRVGPPGRAQDAFH
jgi:hypothetical protein